VSWPALEASSTKLLTTPEHPAWENTILPVKIHAGRGGSRLIRQERL